MKYCFFILLTLAACKNHDNQNFNDEYPPKIDSLKQQSLFDDIKWRLYCIYSDDTINYVNEKGSTITLGMLDLKFANCLQRKDTVIILFDFDKSNISLAKNVPDTLDRLSIKYLFDGGYICCKSLGWL